MNKTKAKATSVEMKVQEKEIKRQKELVKSKFYPYLLNNSTSIEDAKNLLELTATVIQEVFQKNVRDYQTKLSGDKLETLDIVSVIKKEKQYQREIDLIEMFKDETVGTADALITGMKREIEGRIREEGTKRALSTVESDFVDKVNDENNHE